MRKDIVQADRPQRRLNTALALGILDNSCYKHALRIYDAYCFYTATMVTRKHFDSALYMFTFRDVILPTFLRVESL